MHNVRRVRTTAEQREARRKREASEIVRYRRLEDAVLARDPKEPPLQALARTSELLAENPESYTPWNIRRELLMKLADDEQRKQHITSDLKFTESLLPRHPKVYWIWNHRRWVLEHIDSAWERELALVNKLLKRDSRNFHGWTYRRWVLEHAPSHIDSELAFTTKKINENFSNFSAWHHRAQLLPQLEESARPSVRHELDYAYQAVSMDPQDQSAWIYYEWLLSGPLYKRNVTAADLENELEAVREIYEEEDSVPAARMLWTVSLLAGKTPDSAIVDKMVRLDPLRTARYLSLLQSAAAA